jgi:hypothetical protein
MRVSFLTGINGVRTKQYIDDEKKRVKKEGIWPALQRRKNHALHKKRKSNAAGQQLQPVHTLFFLVCLVVKLPRQSFSDEERVGLYKKLYVMTPREPRVVGR